MPLTPPPRDASGEVIPHDHEGIASEDGVIRRVSDQQIIFDPKIGGHRLSSAAFNPSSGPNGGMSVDLQALIEEAGINPQQYVTTPKWMGSIRFMAGSLRTEEFKVGYDPIEEDPPRLQENPYHGEVWGTFNKSKQRKLREMCVWFVPIPGVSV